MPIFIKKYIDMSLKSCAFEVVDYVTFNPSYGKVWEGHSTGVVTKVSKCLSIDSYMVYVKESNDEVSKSYDFDFIFDKEKMKQKRREETLKEIL